MSFLANLDLSRLSQLLMPNGVNQQQQQPVQQPEMSISDIGMNNPNDDELSRAILALLTPKDEQYDRFTAMLQNMPQRSQFAPSRGDRITAALAGLGAVSPAGYSGGKAVGFNGNSAEGMKISQGMLDAPYDRALYDWKNNAGNTLEAAKLENTKNVNSRISGSNIKSAQLREQTIENTAKRNEALTRQGDEKIAIAKANSAIADYKAKNPNKQFKDANGFLVALDPATGLGETVKDKDGNAIETGKLSDEAKAELGLKNALTLEGVRQENRTDLENTRELHRQEDIKARGALPSKTATKPETPQAKQIRLFNKALEGINKNPAWKDYISVDPVRKIFRVATPESKKGFLGKETVKGGDPKVADEIIKYIYGDEKPPSDVAANQAPPAPKGWKYVAKPGGGWTAVEDK